MDVAVKIMLVGGHEYHLSLPSDSPLLKRLFQSVFDTSQDLEFGKNQLFQIPCLDPPNFVSFVGKQVVGIITEPAMLVQPIENFVVGNAALFNPGVKSSPIVAAKTVQIDDFFTPELNQSLLDFVISREAKFITTTHGGKQDFQNRNSLVFPLSPQDIQKIGNLIRASLPEVLHQLEIPEFAIDDIEAQMTAHGDGHYYKIHQDNGTPDLAPRVLTYVYYFCQEPQQFSGGELKIYDYQIEGNRYVKAESFKLIEPRNNSIVFFPSHYLHEVLPVSCPSGLFAHGRFTVNGWVRRKSDGV